MRYVTKTMAVVINSLVIARTGGTKATATNMRLGQTLGFIERIHANVCFGQTIYPDIMHQAAAYMYYIIKNHVFHDGNKRTGLAAAVSFLQWNGHEFHPFDEDSVFDFVIDIARSEGSADDDIERIAAWFATMCRTA